MLPANAIAGLLRTQSIAIKPLSCLYKTIALNAQSEKRTTQVVVNFGNNESATSCKPSGKLSLWNIPNSKISTKMKYLKIC